MAAGTFHAMSPEMLKMFERSLSGQMHEGVSIAHDYYTLGVLLFEFLFPSQVMFFSSTDLETPTGLKQL